MSKISEQKALEEYPIHFSERYSYDNTSKYIREAFIKGYDQAIQDLLKDANQYMFLSDEIGYAYASGCKKTMQDFLEKACKYLAPINYTHPHLIDLDKFKKVLQDELILYNLGQ